MNTLKFDNVVFIPSSWYRVRTKNNKWAPTKTYFRMDPIGLHDKPTYVKVKSEGRRGLGKWHIIFYGELSVLSSVQDPNDVITYYDTSREARQAAEKLIARMDLLRAFM
jgi:hypothetical protein